VAWSAHSHDVADPKTQHSYPVEQCATAFASGDPPLQKHRSGGPSTQAQEQLCPPPSPAAPTITVMFGTAGDLLRIDRFPDYGPATFKRRSP